MPNGLGSTEDQTFIARSESHLTGTLLRQHQPHEDTSMWEPYVLFYQTSKCTIGEIVLWADKDASAKSALWRGCPRIPHQAVCNTPLTVTAAEYGFGLQLFFLAYPPQISRPTPPCSVTQQFTLAFLVASNLWLTFRRDTFLKSLQSGCVNLPVQNLNIKGNIRNRSNPSELSAGSCSGNHQGSGTSGYSAQLNMI